MKLKSRLFWTYILIIIFYSAVALIPKPAAATIAQFHSTADRIRAAAALLIVVEAAIWFVGFYGYAKFSNYARMIKDSEDGKHINRLCKGLLLLALWGPVSSIVSSILNYLTLRHTASLQVTTIIDHYVGLLLPLAAYVFISLGARGLSQMAKQRPSFLAANVLNIILIYISVIFIRLVFTTSHRQLVYQESGWVVMLTLVAPYIYMWSIGTIAAYELFLYGRKSPGTVYRRLWRLLALGFGWLLAGSIIIQFVTVLTFRLRQLTSLHVILLIIYALLAILSIGFVLIARGTAKLQQIEEI